MFRNGYAFQNKTQYFGIGFYRISLPTHRHNIKIQLDLKQESLPNRFKKFIDRLKIHFACCVTLLVRYLLLKNRKIPKTKVMC